MSTRAKAALGLVRAGLLRIPNELWCAQACVGCVFSIYIIHHQQNEDRMVMISRALHTSLAALQRARKNVLAEVERERAALLRANEQGNGRPRTSSHRESAGLPERPQASS